jgi:hypothetical protein
MKIIRIVVIIITQLFHAVMLFQADFLDKQAILLLNPYKFETRKGVDFI